MGTPANVKTYIIINTWRDLAPQLYFNVLNKQWALTVVGLLNHSLFAPRMQFYFRIWRPNKTLTQSRSCNQVFKDLMIVISYLYSDHPSFIDQQFRNTYQSMTSYIGLLLWKMGRTDELAGSKLLSVTASVLGWLLLYTLAPWRSSAI